jgi:GTP-binding protein EngB required for normal cell division
LIRAKKDRGETLTSPLTGLPLSDDKLTPNIELKRDLEIFKASKSTINVSNIKFALSSDIFKDLDRIAALPQMNFFDLQPPQIVVIGNESHGKSTLLERIIGLPILPKDKGLCTRCVIRIHLRRTPISQAIIPEISVKRFGNKTLLDKTDEDLGFPVIITALDNIRERIKGVMDDIITNYGHGRIVIDDFEIIVKINLPYCLNLDLVDVPGLVTTSPTGCTQNLPEVTHHLSLKIINDRKDSSVFLLVNDIRVPPNQSRGCAVIQEAKVENQTLGIFTKVDMFVSEDGDEEAEIRQLLNCKDSCSFSVGYGWMASASKKVDRNDIPSEVSSSELFFLQSMNDENQQMISVLINQRDRYKEKLTIVSILFFIPSLILYLSWSMVASFRQKIKLLN